MDTDRTEMIWPGDPADGSRGTSPANPLQGIGDFIGNLFGGLSGGLLPNAQGEHKGPLADAVQTLFGHDPMSAERYKGALESRRAPLACEPVATRPPFNAPPPRPRDPVAGAVESTVQRPAYARDLPPVPTPVPVPRPAPSAAVAVPEVADPATPTDAANTARTDAIEKSQTPSTDPAVEAARAQDPASLNEKPAQQWVPRSELDAAKPPGALSPKREALAEPKRGPEYSQRTFLPPRAKTFNEVYEEAHSPRVTNSIPPSDKEAVSPAKMGPITIEPFTAVPRTAGRPRNDGVRGMIIHHTEGSVNMNGNASWSNKVGTGANYYIDQKGKVYQWAPDNVAMAHLGRGTPEGTGLRTDLKNGNTLSIEIMTTRGGKPTPEQVEAARQLALMKAKEHGFTVDDVFGHGELASPRHRQATEGRDIADLIRRNRKS